MQTDEKQIYAVIHQGIFTIDFHNSLLHAEGIIFPATTWELGIPSEEVHIIQKRINRA